MADCYYENGISNKYHENLEEQVNEALSNFANSVYHALQDGKSDIRCLLHTFFTNSTIKNLLISLSGIDTFSPILHEKYSNNVPILGALKQLRYFYTLPLIQLIASLEEFTVTKPTSRVWSLLKMKLWDDDQLPTIQVFEFLKSEGITEYDDFADTSEKNNPPAIYPTNMYRADKGYVAISKDYSTFECVMTLSITSSAKIRKNVLEVSNLTLASIYKPHGRCVAFIDEKVDGIYGGNLMSYFNHHGIQLIKLTYPGNEINKDIKYSEQILVDLRKHSVSRNEQVLIMGGGVIGDIGKFACALYHRSTPYVMLCTSVVSAIDAGPSPRTGCNAFAFKNLYGAYHPPAQTIVDRSFFKTMHRGDIRHSIAEIIKIAAVKEEEMLCLLEKAGPQIVETKFGTDNTITPMDTDFENLCDLILGRALASYMKAEYANAWETHQCRPHAFGHTWSPGYELPSGMIHGHAVATGMGFGAYLSFMENWITEVHFKRLMTLLSTFELALWHPIMDDVKLIWQTQVKVTQKRGGRLCAPLPKGCLGQCGYLNDIGYDKLKERLLEYKMICLSYPREGLGIEMHYVDFGRPDPSLICSRHLTNGQNGTGEK